MTATAQKSVPKKTSVPKKKSVTKKKIAKKTATKTKTAVKKPVAKKATSKTTAPKAVVARTSTTRTQNPKITSGMTITEALGESFLTDLITDWQTNGAGVIETCRTTKPDVYLKLIATYAPKEFRKTLEPFEGMTDETLKQRLNQTLEAINALNPDPGSEAGK